MTGRGEEEDEDEDEDDEKENRKRVDRSGYSMHTRSATTRSKQRSSPGPSDTAVGAPTVSAEATPSGSSNERQDKQLPKQQEQSARAASLHAPKRVRANRNKQAESTSKSRAYHSFHALPEYLRDNEYIMKYYRRSMPVRDSVMSLFGLHNETGNIYTHLLGFILFVGLTIYVVQEPPTPLAMGSKQVDVLWNTTQTRLQQLRSHVPGMSLHSLSDTVHSMQEGLHHLQDGLSETVHHLQEGLSDSVHWIQDGISHKSQQLTGGSSSVHWHLAEAMAGLLSWPVPRWPVYVYMGGAMICLLLSAVCHLLGCCQKHISQFVWRLDYAGIATLIVCSFYPPVYYGFMCHRFFLAFYLITTTAMGVGAVLVSLLDRFQEREWRAFRASMFSALGLYGIAPVVHQWWLNSDVPQVRVALFYDLIMGATYLGGAMIFAMRIPEKWFPGKFDLFLHSHQLFHIAVVVGACIHYYSVKLMLEWRDASGGCAAPVTAGPVSLVLQEMEHDLYSIDQVWLGLQHYMTQHLAAGSSTQ